MKAEGSRPCPVCGTPGPSDLGRIVHGQPALVAGIPIDLGGREFRLRGCGACGFQYKDPPIPPEDLLRCYRQASVDHWQESPDPRKRRFDTLAELLEKHARGRRILDVGCFNGALLAYLGPGWLRHGIEPSAEAARLAARRGVRIVAPTLEQVPATLEPFDVVLAIDLVEHLVDPMQFFRRLRPLLSPGGVFVVGTGDTSAWSWRLAGSRYWYCGLPEHVSFFNERCLRSIAASIGLRPAAHRRLSHVRADPYRRLRQLAANLLDAAAWRTRGFGIPPLRRRLEARGAPGWLTARDHMLWVMSSDEATERRSDEGKRGKR
jgi:SAM-dependent methyltransferase